MTFVNLFAGLLTELLFIPALLQKAFFFLTCQRKRVLEETISEIRNEVEQMLRIRAIKLKLRSKFENIQQFPSVLPLSALPGALTSQSSG